MCGMRLDTLAAGWLRTCEVKMTKLDDYIDRNYSLIESMARERAIEAIHQNQPVLAREWTEVAAVAAAAGRGECLSCKRGEE
jgi:hypothetical protein